MSNIISTSNKNQDLASRPENGTKIKKIWSTPKLENLSCSHTLGNTDGTSDGPDGIGAFTGTSKP